MDQMGIQRFAPWRESNDADVASIVAASRQFSQIAGVSLDPKGRWKKEKGESFMKFSVRPKPLKWKGSHGWERVVVSIRRSKDGSMSFMTALDGSPVSPGPSPSWQPMKRAAHAIELVHNKLKKEESNDR